MALLAVHGFGFPEPGSPGDDAPQLYADWGKILGRPVSGFHWYSGPLCLAAEVRALEHGFLDVYAYAYQNLALGAAKRLVAMLEAAAEPSDIVCHSLGSRVALKAAERAPPGSVRRILILDGAEIQPEAPASLPAGISVLNAVVEGDLVLSTLGARFSGVDVAPCIGQAGLGRKMPGWLDVFLDDAATQELARLRHGWTIGASPRQQLLTGDLFADIRNRGNHWAVYASGGGDPDAGNHPLFRAFLDGDDLSVFAPA